MASMENILPPLLEQLSRTQPPKLVNDVEGMISGRVQTLLNRCVAALPAAESYLEIGCWQGASLISALLGNTKATALACDNFAQFTDANPRDKFKANTARYAARLPKFTFHEGDCFELPKKPLFPKPVGIYFYDGDHSEENQMRAFTEFHTVLATNVVVIVDDWNWDYVRRGTWKGIDIVRPKNVWFRDLPSKGNCDLDGFWNGIGAFHLVLR